MSDYDGHSVKRQRLNENGGAAGIPGSDDGSHEHKPRIGDVDIKREHQFREPQQANKVLLFTVLNAIYPITTEVMHKICSNCGEVQRIVIFRKRGVQAMVEFDSIPAAQNAKASLNGADIYSGCCTLKIEYAKPARLNVYKNDDETWDYTGALDNVQQQGSLLGDAPVGYNNYQPPQGMGPRMGHRPPMGPPGMARGRGMGRGRGGMLPGMRPTRPMMPPMQQMGGDYSGGDEYAPNPGMTRSPVMMVYGLDPNKMNADKLFNVLCLYGNIMKVKFLKSKPGTAMVQMGDPAAVDRAIQNLSGVVFFDNKMVCGPSKQLYLADSGQINELADGTPMFVDFSNSRNNRFSTTEAAAKNRIQHPAKILHFFNAPPELSEETVEQLCKEFDVKPPSKFTLFKGRSERSSSGLMEFDSKSEAMEALTMINHYKIDNPNGRFPYILKLCFSTSQGH